MKSLYEDDNMRVDFDDDSQELVVVAKNSPQEDNIVYITANPAGDLTVVAPASKWFPGMINGVEGFHLWLN